MSEDMDAFIESLATKLDELTEHFAMCAVDCVVVSYQTFEIDYYRTNLSGRKTTVGTFLCQNHNDFVAELSTYVGDFKLFRLGGLNPLLENRLRRKFIDEILTEL